MSCQHILASFITRVTQGDLVAVAPFIASDGRPRCSILSSRTERNGDQAKQTYRNVAEAWCNVDLRI